MADIVWTLRKGCVDPFQRPQPDNEEVADSNLYGYRRRFSTAIVGLRTEECDISLLRNKVATLLNPQERAPDSRKYRVFLNKKVIYLGQVYAMILPKGHQEFPSRTSGSYFPKAVIHLKIKQRFSYAVSIMWNRIMQLVEKRAEEDAIFMIKDFTTEFPEGMLGNATVKIEKDTLALLLQVQRGEESSLPDGLKELLAKKYIAAVIFSLRRHCLD